MNEDCLNVALIAMSMLGIAIAFAMWVAYWVTA